MAQWNCFKRDSAHGTADICVTQCYTSCLPIWRPAGATAAGNVTAGNVTAIKYAHVICQAENASMSAVSCQCAPYYWHANTAKPDCAATFGSVLGVKNAIYGWTILAMWVLLSLVSVWQVIAEFRSARSESMVLGPPATPMSPGPQHHKHGDETGLCGSPRSAHSPPTPRGDHWSQPRTGLSIKGKFQLIASAASLSRAAYVATVALSPLGYGTWVRHASPHSCSLSVHRPTLSPSQSHAQIG